MSGYITVTPAYGRDYKTAKAAKADWNEDKDFREIETGSYVNKSQAEQMNLQVIIRFDSLRIVTAVD